MFVEHLIESLRHRLEVPAGEPAVGKKALREDEQIPGTHREIIIIQTKKSPRIHECILFRAHRAAVGERKHFNGDLPHLLVSVSLLPLFYEERIFRKPACVEKERNLVSGSDLPGLSHVLHRHRLSPSGIVGDREHDERNVPGSLFLYELLKGGNIHIALEIGDRTRVPAYGNEQIDGLCAGKFHVGSRGVKMNIIRNTLAGPAEKCEQNLFRRPALVCRNNMFEPRQLPDNPFEPEKAPRARIRFVPLHDAGPLFRAHRGRSAVGQQVYEDVIGPDQEWIEACADQDLLALFGRPKCDRLHDPDFERLDDCFHETVTRSRSSSPKRPQHPRASRGLSGRRVRSGRQPP